MTPDEVSKRWLVCQANCGNLTTNLAVGAIFIAQCWCYIDSAGTSCPGRMYGGEEQEMAIRLQEVATRLCACTCVCLYLLHLHVCVRVVCNHTWYQCAGIREGGLGRAPCTLPWRVN